MNAYLEALEADVEFRPTHRAWHAYHQLTGVDVSIASRLESIVRGGVTALQQWSWALSANWRAEKFPEMHYQTWLDFLPSTDSEDFSRFCGVVLDCLCIHFYRLTWAEVQEHVQRIAEDVKARLEVEVAGG